MIFNMRFHQFFSLFTFFSFFTIQATEQSLHVFQLPRVQVVQQASLEQQEQEIFKRKVSKYAVTAGIAATAVIVLFVAYEIREAARQSRKSDTIIVSKADLQLVASSKPETNSLLTPLWWITSNIKSFVRDSSEFMANSATILASGAILNGASNIMQQKLSAVHQDETVLWYIAQHTQINQILSDLKSNAVEYDLYATLLCAQALNQDAQTHMRAFIKDVIQTTKDQNTIKNSFSDDNYFDFLLGEVKKKYMRQAGEIEALQEYATPIVAKRQRSQTLGQVDELFVNDVHRRKDIACLCQQLVKDIEKLTAFMTIRFSKKTDKIQQLIDSCNTYIALMEDLLNASPETLVQLSKADRGMFTCSYEYERIFNQQVGYMHRYCRMVE